MRWTLLLFGCPYIGTEKLDERFDQDGDGYEAVQWGGEDCDDADELVNPDGTESCNDLDDDCNGLVDDVRAYWPDGDADGWGAGEPVWDCTRPSGYADKDGDCDDATREVSPSADELCNATDDDCDGDIDEGC